MPEQDGSFRPEIDVFEFLGARLEIVDAPGLLRAGHPEGVPLLHGKDFPAPLRRLTVVISTGDRADGRFHEFRGRIQLAAEVPAQQSELVRALGPVAVPAAAAAAVIVSAAAVPLAVAAATAYRARRRAGQESSVEAPTGADDPDTVHDPDTGLAATVRRGRPGVDGRRTDTVVATAPSDAVGPAHVAGFVRVLLDAARRAAGRPEDPQFFAGRSYQLSRYPGGRWADPGDATAVTLDQVGGLPDVVRQLREVAVSFQHPAAMARWGARRPQGILMYGPPGTGKTTLAKALATEIGGTLREIRTPEILDKFVGQSERNIKRIFAEARNYRRPTVLLFDEFDSIISYTGAPMDAASQMVNSVAGIFKQEMNTLVEENPNVIVVATTNFPDRVDDSLVRSGRFDIKMTVPLPDAAARADIFTTILRQLAGRYEVGGFRMFADDLDVQELAALTAGMTGADFKEILRRAQLGKAMQEAHGDTVTPIGQADLRRHVADLRRLA